LRTNENTLSGVVLPPYNKKFIWGPNFIVSLSERKFNTRNVCYDGHVKWTMKIKHTNQLEIAQNEI